MDISAHIGKLLYNHDCVIIPGFGGFVCSYQPAAVNTEQQKVYPPCKAVSFNRFLQNNDGLLVNQLASMKGISFYEASESVNAWVNFSNALLARNEEIVLQDVGRFFNDAEGNLQFELDSNVNYLKSSFGLRPLTATPVIRAKETSKGKGRRLQADVSRWGTMRIAAAVLILTSIVLFAEMMLVDVRIKGLELNQASVASFVNHLFHTEEKRMEPIPIPAQKTSPQTIDTNSLAAAHEPLTPQPEVKQEPVTVAPVLKEEPATISSATVSAGHISYYIIVGAFKDEENAENQRKKLLLKYPTENILFEKHGSLTKVGYYAGDNFSIARQQLISAQSADSSDWMLKK